MKIAARGVDIESNGLLTEYELAMLFESLERVSMYDYWAEITDVILQWLSKFNYLSNRNLYLMIDKDNYDREKQCMFYTYILCE